MLSQQAGSHAAGADQLSWSSFQRESPDNGRAGPEVLSAAGGDTDRMYQKRLLERKMLLQCTDAGVWLQSVLSQ
jgi:hypothetical protein